MAAFAKRSFAKRVADWRADAGLSLHQVAGMLDISWSTISRWERGEKVMAPTWNHATKAHPTLVAAVGEPERLSPWAGGKLGLGTRSGAGRPYASTSLAKTGRMPPTSAKRKAGSWCPRCHRTTPKWHCSLCNPEGASKSASKVKLKLKAKRTQPAPAPQAATQLGDALVEVSVVRTAFQQLTARCTALRDETQALLAQTAQIEQRTHAALAAVAEAFRLD